MEQLGPFTCWNLPIVPSMKYFLITSLATGTASLMKIGIASIIVAWGADTRIGASDLLAWNGSKIWKYKTRGQSYKQFTLEIYESLYEVFLNQVQL